MKRYGNLYEQTISIENLQLADIKARKGKLRSYGVKAHDKNREGNIKALHVALKEKSFTTSSYDTFTIFEPKERLIFRLPYFPDRIVHHAIMNVLEPIFVKTFPFNTYSCIKGRGIEQCAKRVSKLIEKYKDAEKLYCLKIDIKKFYPSVDHEVLKTQLRRKIKDKDLLWLLDDIIDSTDGLPIGNYLSQFLANYNLSKFMHIANEVYRLDCTEYADDIIFLSNDKKSLHKVLHEFIVPYLRDKLRLKVKGNYQVFPVARNRYDKSGRAIDYVGYKFYREQKLIRKSIKQNFCRKVAKLRKRRKENIKQDIAPWLGWCKHSNSRNLLKKLLKEEEYESLL